MSELPYSEQLAERYAIYVKNQRKHGVPAVPYELWVEDQLFIMETLWRDADVKLAEAIELLQFFAHDGDDATELERRASEWLDSTRSSDRS